MECLDGDVNRMVCGDGGGDGWIRVVVGWVRSS